MPRADYVPHVWLETFDELEGDDSDVPSILVSQRLPRFPDVSIDGVCRRRSQ